MVSLTTLQRIIDVSILDHQYVHAEIQLLVHYELERPSLLSRAIGVSKEACFLCDSFIRAHGRFSITGAHRQVFPQWTVPDLVEYTPETIDNFRSVLFQVGTEVAQEHRNLKQRSSGLPIPAQSTINLNAIHLSTPSPSVLSLRSGDVQPSKFIRSAIDSFITPSERRSRLFESVSGYLPAPAELPTWPASKHEGAVNDLDICQQDVPVDVIVDKRLSGRLHWVEIFASLF